MNLLFISQGPDIANLLYTTGFSAPDPVVFLLQGRKKHLVVPLLEWGRAQAAVGQDVRVWTPDMLDIHSTQQRSVTGWAIGLLKQCCLHAVQVSENAPAGLVDALRKAEIDVQLKALPIFPSRAVKTEHEVRCIRQTQQATAKAMKAAIQHIRESRVDARKGLRAGGRRLYSEDIRNTIEQVLLRNQCTASETIVAGGRQGADPHERGHGPLRSDQPIVIDIFPRHREHGYFGDMTRTVIYDRPTPEQQQMYQTVLAAQKQALSMVKPGISGKRIHQEVSRIFTKAGYITRNVNGKVEGFFHGTGHGVGLDIHEEPSISLRPGRLKAGHVVTVEPGLYYAHLGGVRIEDTVWVCPGGYRHLASCSKQFCLHGNG